MKALPLFTIEQTVNTYKYLFEPNPMFGMDFFADDFEAKEIVLLDDIKAGRDTTQFAHAVSLYEQLSSELRMKNDDYKIVAKMLINQLLFLLKREKLNFGLKQNHTRAEQICSEFLLLIEEHYWQKKSVKEYALLLGITAKHLSETVKSTLHHTALSYIHVRIIKEIQYLLCFGDMSIKQIAYALHFETLSQLGRFFKRHEGMSPKAYRLKNRGVALYDKQYDSK
jgi:AraC family transcriptional activator of pobA